VIESRAERGLAPHDAEHGAEDDGHPQQRAKASAKTDAAERGENNQDDRSQEKPNEHLGRSQFSR
jgi:hypothetical protein